MFKKRVRTKKNESYKYIPTTVAFLKKITLNFPHSSSHHRTFPYAISMPTMFFSCFYPTTSLITNQTLDFSLVITLSGGTPCVSLQSVFLFCWPSAIYSLRGMFFYFRAAIVYFFDQWFLIYLSVTSIRASPLSA